MLIKCNNISSKYINIYSLNDKKIGIPIFQRFYDWKEKEIIQFKEDIINILDDQESQLYLLDFIYYEEDGKIKLADGQQRIVTLNNFIKAIKDVASETSLKIDDINLFDINYDVFSNNQLYKTHFEKYPTNPFKKVYISLYQFVKENKDRINDFINIIKNNIYIFLKKCSNADEAFNIFQQINTGGKPLSKDEVIKTALDQYSIAYNIKVKTDDMKNIRQSIISFYKLTTQNFNQNFDNMEIITFLREYVTKNKTIFENFSNTIDKLSVLKNSPIKAVIGYISRNTIMDVVNILTMKKIDIDTDRDYLEKLIIPLCMMSIILTLKGGSPTTFKYLLNEVIFYIKNDYKLDELNYLLISKINTDPITWQITLEEFANILGDSSTSKNIKKALFIIDVILRNVSGKINVNAINLEHIYPQKPSYEWAQNGWPSNIDRQKELIDNIGNYLLLCDSVNKSIQNQYITYKVFKYKQIISKDNVLQTPMNTVDFDKFEKEQRGYIIERQKNIAKLIQENYPFGKVLIK